MSALNWIDFADEIKFRNRFFPRNNQILKFIDQIYDKHLETIAKGSKLYRARLTELSDMKLQEDILTGYSEKGSMAPDAKIATAQRASPEKISYLYVAQDEYTALSETRPGIFSFISLAEIEVLEEMRVFDLWFDIGALSTISDFIYLAMSFSAVIAEKEKEIDYLPMQYVAEYIKTKGADGIKYASYQSQGGKNLVIFEEEKTRFVQSKILYNQNVAYTFLDMTSSENKPLVSTRERRALPKDFAERIKDTVLELQSRKLESNGG